MSDNITLFCLVEGDSKERFFIVITKKNDCVNDLKKKIKEELHPQIENIPAKDIVLWKVNVSTDEDTMEVNIALNDIEEKLKLSHPAKKIRDIFTENITDNSIRIIIEQPSKFINKHGKCEIDKDLINLWNVLKNTRLNKEDEFLQLSGKTSFLGDIDIIYIRKCYRDLLKIVFDENIRRIRISGNPGIGKSVFTYYILYKLAQLNKTIVYNHLGSTFIIFEKEKAFYVNQSIMREYIHCQDVWYIVDATEPEKVKAKTILICSLRLDHYRNFDKYVGTTIRYMPIWSLEEIETCRKRIFNDLEPKKVNDLFSKWGGIPRFVLEKTQDSTQQQLLEEAIVKNSNKRLFTFVGEINHTDNMSNKLLHIYTNIPNKDNENKEDIKIFYKKKFLQFASEYVSKKVIDALIENHRKVLEKFVISSSSINEWSTIRGNVFEDISHRILQKGRRFNIRLLDSKSTDPKSTSSTIEFPKCEKLIFNKINEIKEGMYCQSKSKNFGSIDAIVAPDILFQMTVSSDHPININSLKNLVDKLGGVSGKDPINFYFVLPKDKYNDFKNQKFHTNKNIVAKSKDIPYWITNRIRQYALEIDTISKL
ncbi:hypothetical protein Glove_417g36 [Diversispora epigaea]|uniref:Crinkler effector protein N-terminal domain-containing protein n=1 Tax=Diversispora epigaea TaxID=1348612 RepID=A0A397H052_9GLOM|nr:hypothetical protein Glove_417g36 [Diversispora epigaea]